VGCVRACFGEDPCLDHSGTTSPSSLSSSLPLYRSRDCSLSLRNSSDRAVFFLFLLARLGFCGRKGRGGGGRGRRRRDR
jgi:hypothetical protein